MVYLMPVFLSFVRGHGPLRIGEIMLVTGAAQLLMAPVAVQLEKQIDARLADGHSASLSSPSGSASAQADASTPTTTRCSGRSSSAAPP